MKVRLEYCPVWAAKKEPGRYGIWDLYGWDDDSDGLRSSYPEVVWEACCRRVRGEDNIDRWMRDAHNAFKP